MHVALLVMALAPSLLSAPGDASIPVTLDGRWVATTPDGDKVTFVFAKDGSMLMNNSDPQFKSVARMALRGNI
jgi:hypothetical protein